MGTVAVCQCTMASHKHIECKSEAFSDNVMIFMLHKSTHTTNLTHVWYDKSHTVGELHTGVTA